MNATITLDKAGRVVIPKLVRDTLNLEAGDTLELESAGDVVTLRPVRPASRLQKKMGVWVFNTGRKILAAETDKALQDLRDQRDRENAGDLK
jgi:AbrB family looped-hinge helix DNA binding protein